jgi:GDP-4-dehydro-6-deoxy-D-mannose reductase
MRALITGITGFVGPYLAEHLLAEAPGCEPWGLAWGEAGRAQLEPLQPALRLVEGDLMEPASLVAALEQCRPDVVFHLAAASSVASSWADPATVFQVNVVGQIHLLEAVRTVGLAPRVVVSSSADVYGRVPPESLPAHEELPLAPISPYGASKAAQDLVAAQYFAAHGLPTVRLRCFNHTGPRRPGHFALSSWARQVAEIEAGLAEPTITVGDLDVVRDFTDVRDVVRAYWLAALHGAPGAAYNVCSGTPVPLRRAIELLAGSISPAPAVRVDPGLLRPTDIPALYGDPSRLAAATGWRPSIPLEQTLADLLEWWRQQVRAAR